jgi:flagellar protein FliS
MSYQGQTLAVMNGIELVVALYDGMIRFLYRAIASVEAGDIAGRRESIRRVLEILTYLQARLRADIGGEPAAALSEFYAAMYAQCVRASRDQSIPLLEHTLRNVRCVRDAWQKAAEAETAATERIREQQLRQASPRLTPPPQAAPVPPSNRWSA